MQIALSPQKKAELERPLSTSTAALLALFAGIDYSDRGLYLRAANMYEQALIEDPSLKMAQNALLELKGMGLVTLEELSGEQRGPQPPLPASAPDDGLSTGSIVAIGLGVAAVGGGLAFALGQDDDESETTPVDPEDTTPPQSRLIRQKIPPWTAAEVISSFPFPRQWPRQGRPFSPTKA